MSLILSLETATKVCSVALHYEGELIEQVSISENNSHFEKLPQLIAKVFKGSKFETTDLAGVAVSKGPGSFTGLRIGASMAKGIVYALDIPLIAINSLEAMAFSARELADIHKLLCPMIDARRSEVYCMVVDNKMQALWPTRALIISEGSFDSLINNSELILFGDGSLKFKSTFEGVDAIQFENVEPNANSIGLLAWRKFQEEEFEDTAYFEPYYLKDFRPGLSKKTLTL